MPLALLVDPNPLLDLWVFASQLPAPLGEMATSPAVTAALDRAASAPLAADDEVRQRIRGLLRAGGFKPTGRSKPASEYLLAAAAEAPLRSINPAVDAGNAVSLHSGVPVSVVDLARVASPLRVAIAPAGSSYVFNPSGQVIDVEGLVCLLDEGGPCANAVKDAQRSKTDGETRATLSILWGTTALPGRAEAAFRWYGELLASMGIAAELVHSPGRS
ncbi:MAG TPA: phenylalanine--tRNA ligase beta subunit-related protein [Kofleriaceae bacterium]|nr:phenylalanine--tRNA ligase beta subunit-related protein [Kofleriaceae bacterium]